MKAVVPLSSLEGSKIALYSFIMPSFSRRFVFAKTVVIGELTFLAICLAVSLQLFCIRARIARSFLSSFGCIVVIITLFSYKKASNL